MDGLYPVLRIRDPVPFWPLDPVPFLAPGSSAFWPLDPDPGYATLITSLNDTVIQGFFNCIICSSNVTAVKEQTFHKRSDI
jgi:hypothetical protein